MKVPVISVYWESMWVYFEGIKGGKKADSNTGYSLFLCL